MTETHASEQAPIVGDPPTAPEATMNGTVAVENPFPGPKPYRREQEELFFGRDNEIEELTSLVLSTKAILLYAQSGSGKSSLLQAGLEPNLKQFGVRVLPTVRFDRVGLDPSRGGEGEARPNPFTELVFDSVLPEDVPRPDKYDLKRLAGRLQGGDGDGSVLLVLDQFEELFAEQALWQERRIFLRQLRSMLDENTWLRTILAIRSDHLADLLPYERELPSRTLIRFGLESLSEQPAREAIGEAFRRTGVPLTPTETDRVLNRLLSLDVGVPGSSVRAEHVNLIQMQILCRRLWKEKARAASARGTGASGDSQVLREPDVDLADSMRSFVDDAVASAVTRTHASEGAVRRWLEDGLISSGKRVTLLADNEKTTGIPDAILEALKDARLVQVEQRNRSQYAELTHDSMVGAVLASNSAWFSRKRRARHRLTAVLMIMLVGLLGVFVRLRTPVDETLLKEAQGIIRTSPVRIPIPPTPEGHVAAVQVQVDGYGAQEVTVRAVTRDGTRRDMELMRVAGLPLSSEGNGTVEWAIETNPSASYALIMDAPGREGVGSELRYRVVVRSALVIRDGQNPGASGTVPVRSSLVAFRVDKAQPVHVDIGGATLQDVWVAQSLLSGDSEQNAVIESPDQAGWAVLLVDGDSGDDLREAKLTRRPLPRERPRLGAGGRVDVHGGPAWINPVDVRPLGAPFSVDASCVDRTSIDVISRGERSVKSAAEASPSTHYNTSRPSVLVPAASPGGYRAVLIADAGAGLHCHVRVRSFARQRITIDDRKVRIEANKTYNVYRVRTAADSVVLVSKLEAASASLNCLQGTIMESEATRLLAFVPAQQDCVLSITRSEAEPEEALKKPVSLPVRILPVAGG